MLVHPVIQIAEVDAQTGVAIFIAIRKEPFVGSFGLFECLFIAASHEERGNQSKASPCDLLMRPGTLEQDDRLHVVKDGLFILLVRIEHIGHHAMRFGPQIFGVGVLRYR